MATEYHDLVQTVYYTGAGAVLYATSLRFLWQFGSRLNKDVETLNELRDIDVKAHLRRIYTALQTIADELNIRLHMEEGTWILSDSQQKKK